MPDFHDYLSQDDSQPDGQPMDHIPPLEEKRVNIEKGIRELISLASQITYEQYMSDRQSFQKYIALAKAALTRLALDISDFEGTIEIDYLKPGFTTQISSYFRSAIEKITGSIDFISMVEQMDQMKRKELVTAAASARKLMGEIEKRIREQEDIIDKSNPNVAD